MQFPEEQIIEILTFIKTCKKYQGQFNQPNSLEKIIFVHYSAIVDFP